MTMTALWRYGVLFCNSVMTFGVYYFLEFPISVQDEMMNSNLSTINTTVNHTCKVCLGLGEVRYNLLYAITRWASIFICLPSGVLIDKIGNGRSAVLFSTLPFVGSILFCVGAIATVPVTMPMYILMLIGNILLAFGDGALRFVQARVVAHCFPDGTITALAFGTFGYFGQCVALYVSPIVATKVGFLPALLLYITHNSFRSVWMLTYAVVTMFNHHHFYGDDITYNGVAACALGVTCAIGLSLFLRVQPTPVIADDRHNKMLTIDEFRSLPGTYWLYVFSTGLTSACWIVKQINLPDFLQIQHGYTMAEASYITGLSSLMLLLSPALCLALKKVNCDGIMDLIFLIWLVPLFILLGFCPSVSVIAIGIGDGIGITVVTVMTWQLLVVLCPPTHVGTLGGLMYLIANIMSALIILVSGYILERYSTAEQNETLVRYHHFFLMIIILSSISVIFGIVMNVLDHRKSGVLNNRIRSWQQMEKENSSLMPEINSLNKYSSINGDKEELTMKSE